jgi:anti-sigma B factor antagonist
MGEMCMNLSISLENAGGNYVLFLSGELDAFTAQQLKERLIPLVQQGEERTVIVDLKHVTYMDSTGIGIFIGALKAAIQSGCRLLLENVPPRIDRLFRITGLHEIITITPLKGEDA